MEKLSNVESNPKGRGFILSLVGSCLDVGKKVRLILVHTRARHRFVAYKRHLLFDVVLCVSIKRGLTKEKKKEKKKGHNNLSSTILYHNIELYSYEYNISNTSKYSNSALDGAICRNNTPPARAVPYAQL